jgi:xanthine dehydrogenase accessory factor
MKEIWRALLEVGEGAGPAALVTVVSARGSTPQKPGAKMLVYADGRIVGTIGGGCLEAEMARRARQAIATGRTLLTEFDLTPEQAGEDGLICGGRMEVFIEPLERTPTLCVLGAGHVAVPLAALAHRCGFRVEVLDDRVQFVNAERFPDADTLFVEPFSAAATRLTLGSDTYAVVATRGHAGDLEALAAVVGRGLRYVGLVGSRAKAVHLLSALRERGASAEDLAAIHVPVGLAIGAVSPEEIAVSILAEMIAVRRGVDPRRSGSLRIELPLALGPRGSDDDPTRLGSDVARDDSTS